MENHNLRMAFHSAYLAYSPDLTPIDFFLFDHVKRTLQEAEFQSPDELLDSVVQIVTYIPPDTLMATFHSWMDRLQACIDGGGEYVE
jgi:hypothetical protein